MKKSNNNIERIILKPAKRNNLPPVLLVHGAWHGAWCWENFALYLNEKGFEVHYFSLPGHGSSSLGKKKLNHYSLTDYVDFLSERIAEIEQTPIVIAHSMGGALLQIYLQNNTLPAAILMASIPKQGTLPLITRILFRFPLALLRSILTYKSEVIVATPERARALFFSEENTIDYAKTQKLLSSESMRILFPLMYWGTFKKIKQGTPTYIIAGGQDKITSIAEQRGLAKYLKADFSVIDGQAHCIMLEPAYKSVVNLIHDWLKKKTL